MHAVHESPVGVDDDREGQVDGIDKAGVFGDGPDRGLGFVRVPPVLVELGDLVQWEVFRRLIAREVDEALDIPSVESTRARPEVELLPHSGRLIALVHATIQVADPLCVKTRVCVPG
jgi:hypothetical protein